MTYTIAVAGKGGTGKTTISSLIIRYLKKHHAGIVLAVDADPNANLGEGLGLEVKDTVGAVLDGFNSEKINIPAGITKEAYLEVKLNQMIVEGEGLDLVSMGRSEGPGCYCYPNTVLRKFLDTLMTNYPYMVMDNEAGMEHLSRRTTQNVDDLLLISDHAVKGVRTLARIRDLVTELKLDVKRQFVIINFVPDQLDPAVAEELKRLKLHVDATIPPDDEISEFDLKQRSLLELPDTSKAVIAVDRLMEQVLNKQKVT